MEPPAARRFAEDGLSPFDVAAVPMASVIDRSIAGVPVRMFVPDRASHHVIVYFHGGGGVIGSIRSSEPVTRLIAAQTRATVVSVEYRLGPEHKHPAAIDDSVAVYNALAAECRGRIAVAGDSFGGFLATHVDRSTGDAPPTGAPRSTVRRRPDLQVLIYPIVDLTLTSPSIDRFADGYLLTRSMMQWFRHHYLHATDDRRAASPAYWPSHQAAAPAIVVTAGFDPLVDEGDNYARALAAADVPVVHRRHDHLIHGFLSFAGAVRAARAATDQLCSDIANQLAR